MAAHTPLSQLPEDVSLEVNVSYSCAIKVYWLFFFIKKQLHRGTIERTSTTVESTQKSHVAQFNVRAVARPGFHVVKFPTMQSSFFVSYHILVFW